MDELADIIREEIGRDGPMTFARYMALALYHPTLGYYAGGGAGREPLGWTGDYFTSGDVSPLWGWAIARQLRQMWELLGCPPRFDVIEPGAGRGLLAREVWRFTRFSAPEWGEALRYTLVDQAAQSDGAGVRAASGETRLAPGGDSDAQTGETGLAPTSVRGGTARSSLFEARRERLAAELARIGVVAGAVRWVGSLDEMSGDFNAEDAERTQRPPRLQGRRQADEQRHDETDAASPSLSSAAPSAFHARSASSAVNPLRSITGVIVSNELLDALPTHVVEVVGDAQPTLAEVYVDVDAGGRLVERLDAPSSPAVAGYLDRFGVPWRAFGPGWRAEIGLAAETWMREAASLLRRGFALTIDYGATARRLYTRDRRRGTLAVYAHHQFGDRPLAAPGWQDITAHVNFSALARAGSARGLRVAGYTTQAAFLGALGVREAAEALGKRLYPAADTARPTDRGQADLLRRRLLEGAAATLLDPRGLGGFRVLVQQRGVQAARNRLFGLAR